MTIIDWFGQLLRELFTKDVISLCKPSPFIFISQTFSLRSLPFFQKTKFIWSFVTCYEI